MSFHPSFGNCVNFLLLFAPRAPKSSTSAPQLVLFIGGRSSKKPPCPTLTSPSSFYLISELPHAFGFLDLNDNEFLIDRGNVKPRLESPFTEMLTSKTQR